MKEQFLKFFFDHLAVILMAIFHFLSMITQSIIEYKIGENPELKNSLLAIIKNKIWGK